MKIGANIYSRYFTYIKPVTRIPIVRTYGTAIFTVFVMAIFVLFAIKPTVETILVLQKKLENSNQVLEQVQKKAENLSQAIHNYQNLDNSVKTKIQVAIPDTVDLRSIVKTLEDTARKHEASISALQIQPHTFEAKENTVTVGKKVGTLTEVNFTYNVEGEYKNIISILQDLQGSSRLISIDNLSLNKLVEGSRIIMSITGKAWYLK